MNRLAILIAIYALLGCSAALDSKVIIPCERTLFVDLGEGYEIKMGDIQVSDGIFMEEFTINKPGEGGAIGIVFAPYDNIVKIILNKELMQKLISIIMMEIVGESTDTRDMGNWMVNSYHGEAVMVNNITFTLNELAGTNKQQFGIDAYMAAWHVGDDSYIMLLSMLDSNTTSRIISTARIV